MSGLADSELCKPAAEPAGIQLPKPKTPSISFLIDANDTQIHSHTKELPDSTTVNVAQTSALPSSDAIKAITPPFVPLPFPTSTNSHRVHFLTPPGAPFSSDPHLHKISNNSQNSHPSSDQWPGENNVGIGHEVQRLPPIANILPMSQYAVPQQYGSLNENSSLPVATARSTITHHNTINGGIVFAPPPEINPYYLNPFPPNPGLNPVYEAYHASFLGHPSLNFQTFPFNPSTNPVSYTYNVNGVDQLGPDRLPAPRWDQSGTSQEHQFGRVIVNETTRRLPPKTRSIRRGTLLHQQHTDWGQVSSTGDDSDTTSSGLTRRRKYRSNSTPLPYIRKFNEAASYKNSVEGRLPQDAIMRQQRQAPSRGLEGQRPASQKSAGTTAISGSTATGSNSATQTSNSAHTRPSSYSSENTSIDSTNGGEEGQKPSTLTTKKDDPTSLIIARRENGVITTVTIKGERGNTELKFAGGTEFSVTTAEKAATYDQTVSGDDPKETLISPDLSSENNRGYAPSDPFQYLVQQTPQYSPATSSQIPRKQDSTSANTSKQKESAEEKLLEFEDGQYTDVRRPIQETVTFDPYSPEDLDIFNDCIEEGDGNFLRSVQILSSANSGGVHRSVPGTSGQRNGREVSVIPFASKKRLTSEVCLLIPSTQRK